MDFASLLNTALVVLTLTTAAGLGLLAARQKGLSADVKRQTDRADSADREAVSLQIRLDSREKEITDLKARVALLTEIATGEVHWESLKDQLEVHHKASMSGLAETTHLLEEIRDAVREDS